MFPADSILLARGKYATLGAARRALLKSAQAACSLLMDQASQIMRDVEQEPPCKPEHLQAAFDCLEQAGNARAELIKICEQMIELKQEAWGVKDPA